ncbi:MAG: glutamate synthase subunit beta [Phycisphaerales bacterium]|nr:glutamate synthase subunit beta [Phycisphaerales bacterium]
MGKPTGFMEYPRQVPGKLPIEERKQHYREFEIPLPVEQLREQGARCMDCGLPFCHTGCPLGNIIPDFNDLVYQGDWAEAIRRLHATNNFPEFTGRVCPAPCEEACVLGIIEPPVTIKNIENAIIERAFKEGWIKPEPPKLRTGKTVAVIGSGPAGLAVAHQLNRAGHMVTVFERADRIGGLLRYGIPDFKLEKSVIDRRLKLMEEEGIVFKTGVNVGTDLGGEQLRSIYDVIVMAIGSTRPRDLTVEGRDLQGIHFAMDYLPQQNRRVAGDAQAWTAQSWWFGGRGQDILATDRQVIVIGGGDTGSDCVGTANRQGAKSITQFELLPQPPQGRPEQQPWPYYPMKLRTSSSHEEGCQRHWSLSTKRFLGRDGHVTDLETVELEWLPNPSSGRLEMREKSGTLQRWPADLVLLAMGFTSPEPGGIVEQLALNLDPRGNILADENTYMTNVPGVFACGDARRGQSLVVWAISEGRETARAVDLYLMGRTSLPTKGEGDLPRR